MSDKTQIDLNTVIVQASDILVTDYNDDLVMMSIDQGKYYVASETGRRIWSLSVAPIVIKDICAALMQDYEVKAQMCEAEVLEFVEAMHRERILLITTL